MSALRWLKHPHNAIHAVMVLAGVVLIAAGYSAGFALIACAAMMWLMMGVMGGHQEGHGHGEHGRHGQQP
jgi:hypothetical protein